MSTMHAETLDNGLLILLAEQHTVPVATFWVWYRAGSRNEMPGLTGISHWVEHMLFKGTPTHPKGMLTRHIDRLGGRWNAFTWKDYTAYHEVLPADHLGVAIALEADRMINTVMEPAEVESERTVIISEREGSENYPAYLLREEVDAAAHKVHPYRIPVIGWKDDLRAITRDDLSHHYQTYYHPNNAVAVAVGPFDAHAVMEAIKQAFAGIPPGSSPPRVRVREPQQEGERRVVLRRPGGATAYLHIAFHVPSASHQDLASLLTRIDRVTLDDVLRVADTYFTEKNRTVGWYLPEGGATTAGARAAVRPEVFFWSPLRAQLQVPPITPRTVARTELRNGMVVLVKETPGTGLVAVHGYIKAGAMYDGTRSGLARYVAAMLQRGTRRDSSQELAEHLDGLGASLVIRADMEVAGIGLRALAEDAAEALHLLGDVLIHPTFPSDEIEKARGELLTSVRIGMQETRLMAERAFRRLLFPESHPHRQVPDGDEVAIASLTRQDLETFHRDRYRPEATLLAVVGDIRPADVLATVDELFTPWPQRGGWALPPVPPVPRPAGRLRGEHRMQGKTQSDIVLGVPGVARADPAYYEMMMANLILGQLGMMGRLGDRVRERQGMAYYAC